MKKMRKITTLIFFSTVVLLVLLVIFSQTPLFKSWLKNRVIAYVEASTQTHLEIKKLRGNLYSFLQIEDLVWTIDKKKFFTVKRVLLQYRPMALLLKKIEIQQILVEQPVVFLDQKADSSWNFQRMLSAKPHEKAGIPDSSSVFDWGISLEKCKIVAGSAQIQRAPKTAIVLPEKISRLNLDFSFFMFDDILNLALEQFSFQTENPDFSFSVSKTAFESNQEETHLKDLSIQTGSSKVSSNIDFINKKPKTLNLLLKGAPVDLSEVRRFLPSFEFYGTPRINIETRGRLDDLTLNCNLQSGQSVVRLWGNVHVATKPYGYHLQGQVRNLNLYESLHDSSLTTDLNLTFAVDGKGTDPEKMRAKFSLQVDSSVVAAKKINSMQMHGAILDDSLSVQLDAVVEGAKFALQGNLNFLPREAGLHYAANGTVHRFDLSRFSNAQNIRSDVNVAFALRGSGTDLKTMNGQLDLRLLPSSLNHVPIDSAAIQWTFADERLDVHRFKIVSPLGTLHANGHLSVHGENALTVDADFDDVSVLSPVLPVDSLSGSGSFHGSVTGPADSLNVKTNFTFSHFGNRDAQVGQFSGTATGVIYSDRQRFSFRGKAERLRASSFQLTKALVAIDYADSSADFDVNLLNGTEYSFKTAGIVKLQPEETSIEISDLGLQYKQLIWEKGQTPTMIKMRNTSYEVTGFDLYSDAQKLSFSGRLDPLAENHFQIDLSHLNLDTLRRRMGMDADIGGDLNLKLLFTGQFSRPKLDVEFDVNNGHSYHVTYKKIRGNFGFDDEKFLWNGVLSKTESDSLFETSGYVPLHLSFSPFQHAIYNDRQLVLKVSTHGIDLSFLQPLIRGIENVHGKIVGDIVISNTLSDLRGVGPLRLINGAVDVPEIGTKYRKINLVLFLNDKEVLIRDFRLRSGDGSLKIVDGSLSLSSDEVQAFNAKFRLNDFQMMNNKKMKAKVDGDIELSGSIQSPTFSGDLTVTECVIFYEKWFGNEAVYLTSKPFFVISPDSIKQDSSGAVRFQKKIKGAETIFTETRFYKSLQGELSLTFPRNTWIRSGDANIEIEGDLAAVKESDDIALFGSFSTIRGFYSLLGNRFQIKKGEMIFDGNPDYNPEVSIEATYFLESSNGADREKQEFDVIISGTLFYPEFRFTLDGNEVEQNDLISILLFGKRFADSPLGQIGGSQGLSSAKKSGQSGTGLDKQATGALTGQILKQLSGKLGDQLRLDMIQIEKGNSWKDSSVRIGKYLTPDVFVSVSQDFGDQGNQTVDLEYEFPRILFFNLLLQASSESQGNSALDVIWKIEW